MSTPHRALVLTSSLIALMSTTASAQVVIDNGTIQLGINPAGNLVTGGIGLTFLTTTAASGQTASTCPP